MKTIITALALLASIEGKWLGTAGFPEDRVQLGLEFKRDANGQLHAHLYMPVMNFYGLDGGLVKQNGDTYVIEDFVASFTLRDDKLEGTYFSLKAPASLERTTTLPQEVPVPKLPPGPGPRWRTKLGAAIYAPAAIRDGVAYVGTSGGMFYAIGMKDGAFVWAVNAGRAIHGEALATDDAVFFACDNGYLYKLERKTGKELWRYDLGDARVSRVLPHQVLPNSGDFDFYVTSASPLLEGGVLYIGSGDGSLHAINPASGERVWRFEGAGAMRTDPAIDATRIYAGTIGSASSGIVYAIDRQTGRELWKKETYGPVTSSPLLIGEQLVIGNRNGLLAALDPATGTVKWRMTLWGSAVESTPVRGENGLFYIGSSDARRVMLRDSKDGRVVWRTDVFGWAWPRPALTPKFVFASAGGVSPYQMRHLGSLSKLDRATGRIVWRWPMPEWPGSWTSGFAAAPAVGENLVVVGGLDGTLYSFPEE